MDHPSRTVLNHRSSALLSCLLWIGVAGAQDSDLAVQLTIRPSTMLAPPSMGELEIQVTNHGPSPDGARFQVSSVPQPNGQTGYPALTFTAQTSGLCGPHPSLSPPPGAPLGIVATPVLMAGESETCSYSFQINEPPLPRASLIQVFVRSVFSTTSDPDPTNSTAQLTVSFGPPRVVNVVNSWSVLVLVAAVVATVCLRQREGPNRG